MLEVNKFIRFGKSLERFGRIQKLEEDKVVIYDLDQGGKIRRSISSTNYKVVDKPTAYDLIEMCTWDFNMFKKLHEEFPFNLNLKEEPLVNHQDKVLYDSWTFYSMIFTGYRVLNQENLENALYLINHNANIDEETWLHFLHYLNEPYDSANTYFKKDRKEIKQNQDLLTRVILGLIRNGGDPFVKDDDGKYALFEALRKMKNKKVLEELTEDAEIEEKIQIIMNRNV